MRPFPAILAIPALNEFFLTLVIFVCFVVDCPAGGRRQG
jgi:hypothetical protein